MKNFYISVLLVLLVCGPVTAHAQSVFFDSADTRIDQDELARVNVRVDTAGYFINAFELYVSYTDTIDIVDISRGNSFADTWVRAPRIDEERHKIVFIGGVTHGTTMNDGILAQLLMKGKAAGDAELTLDTTRSAVYIDDGLGTELSLQSVPFSLTVSDVAFTPSIEIYSPTHPREDAWYSNNAVRMSWYGEDNAVYSYSLSKSFSEEPDNAPEGEGLTTTYFDLRDGEYVFAIKEARDSGGWSDVSRRIVRIDTTAPRIEDVTLTNEATFSTDQPTLFFHAFDDTSGVVRVSLSEGGQIFTDVDSPYTFQTNSEDYSITAIDAAGNETTVRHVRVMEHQRSWLVYLAIVVLLLCVGYFIKKIQRHATLPSVKD